MKALIPAAGLGTRWYPWSRIVPKELLPLGKYPAIHFILEETVAAGIYSIGIIISEAKILIKKYVEFYWKPKNPDAQVLWFNQSSPCGVADALFRAKDWVGNSPIAVLYPDEIHPNGGGIEYILNKFKMSDCNLLGLTRKKQNRRQASFAIQEKTDIAAYKLGLANSCQVQQIGYGTGRYILKNGLSGTEQSLVRKHKMWSKEFDDTDFFRSLWSQGFMGIFLPGEIHDIGTIENWKSAVCKIRETNSYSLVDE